MSGGLTGTFEAQVLDLLLSNTAFGIAVPATWYYALFTTNPAQDGTGAVEAAWTGYARTGKTNNVTNFPAASGAPASKSNGATIDFGITGSGPTTVVGVGLYDAVTSGHLWMFGSIGPYSIASGQDVFFASGNLTFTLT